MKKLNVVIYQLENQKIKAIEKYINELVEELAKNGIIELENKNNSDENDQSDY